MTCKTLSELCESKMPGTRYDKFFVETLVKKYPGQEKLEGLLKQVEELQGDTVEEVVVAFKKIVETDEERKENERKEQQ